jgi:two-component system phosphate regulon response regulator OmpR
MIAETPHALVIDDDDRLRDLLGKYLGEHGFMVITARDAEDARRKMIIFAFDIIILDLMMPGESGLEFTEDLRTKSDIPILMLTAMGESENRIEGLERGADDYLIKPFEPKELLLRLNSILKRLPKVEVVISDIHMGDVIFSLQRGELNRDNQQVHLTDVEGALLGALARHSGKVLSREELINLTGANGGGRAIDVQVTRLRRKIEKQAKIPRYLQTVRGKGYVLRPD